MDTGAGTILLSSAFASLFSAFSFLLSLTPDAVGTLPLWHLLYSFSVGAGMWLGGTDRTPTHPQIQGQERIGLYQSDHRVDHGDEFLKGMRHNLIHDEDNTAEKDRSKRTAVK